MFISLLYLEYECVSKCKASLHPLFIKMLQNRTKMQGVQIRTYEACKCLNVIAFIEGHNLPRVILQIYLKSEIAIFLLMCKLCVIVICR